LCHIHDDEERKNIEEIPLYEFIQAYTANREY
jgi:hypothetical protein